MDNKLQILKHPIVLLFLGLGLLTAFFVFYIVAVPREVDESPPLPEATPTKSLPKNLDLYLKKEPSTQSLTEEEVKYTEATPQAFPQATNPSRTGTLIVASDPPNINVVLEEKFGEEVSEYRLPYNASPFKASDVPVGNYIISAAADGYEYTGESFIIEENKITRVFIQLMPLRN